MEVNKFFNKLFESREMAHIFHLKSKNDGSFAEHKALNEFYEEIIDKIDFLIEVYQGQYKIVDDYQNIDVSYTRKYEPIEYFKDLIDYIRKERDKAFDKKDTHLINITDEIIAIIYHLLYKLKYLK